MAITTEIREVTPEEAISILERNPDNRIVRQIRVQQLARDMKAGRWRLNGEAIKFNGNENLMDGQHRLLACVVAGKSFTTLIVRGLTDADHSTIDTGSSRTFSDELRWRGETNCAELAATVNLGWVYDEGSAAKSGKFGGSRGELLGWLRRNPDIRKSVSASRPVKELGIRRTAFGITHYLVLREHGEDVADLFTAHLLRGTNYADGDPCLVLRNYAVNLTARPTLRPSTVEWFAVILKAANAFLTGTPVRALRWRRLGPKRENFPTLVTKDNAIDVRDEYADDLS